MDAFLRLEASRRKVLCEEAASALGLATASIEKDFWVCWTLRELFGLPGWGEHLAFKGGTSLSKGWKLIERFSEDIDVVISREFLGFAGATLSNNRQKKLVRTCSARIHQELMPALTARISAQIPKSEKWSLVPASKQEDGDQQTLLFNYPQALADDAPAYLQRTVRIEMGARSATEPVEHPMLQPYLCEAMPDAIGDGRFSIRTVVARRTFWDKVMLLHEETHRPPDRAARKNRMSRHYYDVWSLIRNGVADQAMADEGLFDRVAAYRVAFFGYSWMDYSTLRPGSLRLLPPDEQVSAWKSDYDAMRAEMFFGDPPSFDEVMAVVADFERRFNSSASS